jgi:hypothetical protein
MPHTDEEKDYCKAVAIMLKFNNIQKKMRSEIQTIPYITVTVFRTHGRK